MNILSRIRRTNETILPDTEAGLQKRIQSLQESIETQGATYTRLIGQRNMEIFEMAKTLLENGLPVPATVQERVVVNIEPIIRTAPRRVLEGHEDFQDTVRLTEPSNSGF